MTPPLAQRAVAEFLGTALLLAAVVGSGIMGERLAGGNVAIALLANSLATGAILVVLILIFGPVSGAHFNPAVSLAFALRGELSWRLVALYALVQVAGGFIGVWAAHAMFDLPVLQISMHARSGSGQWLAEFIAAFGLLLTILGCVSRAPAATPYAVGLYITARPIGSPPQPSSPIPPSPSRAHFPIPSPVLRQPAFPPSSSPSLQALGQPWLWPGSFGGNRLLSLFK